jgi:hypothetical protein
VKESVDQVAYVIRQALRDWGSTLRLALLLLVAGVAIGIIMHLKGS